MSLTENIWPKKITVDKRIVSILSGSTYDNFPKALKEIITNSYDADASEVRIDIDERREVITIEDNGIGMSENDFDFYLRIAGKSRSSREFTTAGRKRIGQFGVGFLAVFPFCKQYNIESKKKGSAEILFASIPNHQYLRGDEKLIDVEEIPIQGGKRIDRSLLSKQFTKIKLVGFTRLTLDFFKHAYKLNNRRETILNYPPVQRMEWELCEDLPIEYPRETALNELFPKLGNLDFRVYLNENVSPLSRNVHASTILETHKGAFETIGKIRFKYFIASDYKPVKPVEGRFLKIRNFDVGVGPRRTFGIGLEGRTYARLAHLTGEIHILEGLNDLINVSRDDFNFSPDLEALQEFFRGKLRYWADELDRLAETEKFLSESTTTKPIKSLQALDQQNVVEKIRNLKQKGFKVSSKKNPSDQVKIDKAKKEILISNASEDDLSKNIVVNGRTFKLKLDESLNDNITLPCRISGSSIYINRNYPLFRDNKRLDVLIKIHAILSLAQLDGTISQKAHEKIAENILKTLNDYIK